MYFGLLTNSNFVSPTILQEVKTNLSSAPIDVQLKKLEDYYMTDVISRSSVTMSKCVQAVLKQKRNKYYDGKE